MKKISGVILVIIVATVITFGFIIFNSLTNNSNDNIKTYKDTEYENHSNTQIVATYNNPIVPEGFKKIETDSASWELEDAIPKGWNDGLVIEDEIGNQFVWIPVDCNNLTYSSRAFKRYLYSKDDMNKNIIKYGGFYVSRYEAGVPIELQDIVDNVNEETNNIEGIPVSRKGARVWNFISYGNASKNAKSMYHEEGIKSDLLSMKEVVLILEWLSTKYDVYSNSTSWGNYSNNIFKFTGIYSGDYGKTYQYGEDMSKTYRNIIIATGASEETIANNLYDIAGNVWECTNTPLEENDEFHLSYGGHYDTPGDNHNAASIYNHSKDPSDKIGFRIYLIME